VSWGGISDWDLLNMDPQIHTVSIADLHAGKFLHHAPGDARSDIFWTDGNSWFLSYAGSGAFMFANTSSKSINDLRFGDFDGDGMTDIFGVVLFGPNDWRWAFSKSAQGAWADGVLQSAAKDQYGNLLQARELQVADFDGDGRADVAANGNSVEDWMISFAGVGDLVHFNVPSAGVCGYKFGGPLAMSAGIGHFAQNKGVDILFWDGPPVDTPPESSGNNEMCIAPGGNEPRQVGWASDRRGWSRQDMR
jgi:hypothetical protein